MNLAILFYMNQRYTNIMIPLLRDKFVEQFSYMESCNMGLLFPEKYIDSAPKYFLSPIINEGMMIRW